MLTDNSAQELRIQASRTLVSWAAPFRVDPLKAAQQQQASTPDVSLSVKEWLQYWVLLHGALVKQTCTHPL